MKIQEKILKKGYSFWALIFIVFWFLSADFIHHNWRFDEPGARRIINYDVEGYYGYLPATFIFDDYKLDFTKEKGFKNDYRFMFIRLDNGNYLIQYTTGLSILYAPFFFTAHALAPIFGQERDGYNLVYQFFLVLSALFYVTLGLIFLRKLLLKYFADTVVALALIIVTLGTNLFYYTVYEGPMPHSYSFAFIAIFLYLVNKWYEKQSMLRTILLGAVFGLIVLIRPSNVFIVFILVLWEVKTFDDFKKRISFLLNKTPLILLMIFFFILPWLPQLMYWKSITGHFFYNSYEEVGAAFYLDAPQTHKMLFSYRKGWFIYTPLMFLASFGFIALFRKRREHFWSLAIFMLVIVYVLSSWWSWWFGGGFGSRSMVDTYPIMIFPLAAGIEWLMKERRTVLRYSLSGIIILLFALQLLQTKQYTKGEIHFVSMDKDAYWHKFLKVNGRGTGPLLSDPDHTLARQGIYYFYDRSYDYDAFREMDEAAAKDMIEEELNGDPKMLRSIKRYARRFDLTMDEGEEMVVNRVYEYKRIKNLK